MNVINVLKEQILLL